MPNRHPLCARVVGAAACLLWGACSAVPASAGEAEWRVADAAVRQRVWIDGSVVDEDVRDCVLQLRMGPELLQGLGDEASIVACDPTDGTRFASCAVHVDAAEGIVVDVRIPLIRAGAVHELVHLYATPGAGTVGEEARLDARTLTVDASALASPGHFLLPIRFSDKSKPTALPGWRRPAFRASPGQSIALSLDEADLEQTGSWTFECLVQPARPGAGVHAQAIAAGYIGAEAGREPVINFGVIGEHFHTDSRTGADGGWVGATNADRRLIPGAWHAFSAVYDHERGVTRVYLDGAPAGEGKFASDGLRLDRLFLGTWASGDWMWTGAIDQVAVTPMALPDAAVRVRGAALASEPQSLAIGPVERRGEPAPVAPVRCLAPREALERYEQPVFRWSLTPESRRYALKVWEGDQEEPVLSAMTEETTYAADIPLRPGGGYRWQVTAQGSRGETVDSAAFTVSADYIEARMVPPRALAAWADVSDYEEECREMLNMETLPIRTDLDGAIHLCLHQLSQYFDRDRNDEPFFYANREADGTGKLRHSVEIGIPHVVGRNLLGSMAALEGVGIQTDDRTLDILERYCRESFDTPDHLNAFYREEAPDAPRYEFHNIREGLFGLVSLVAVRGSEWAREKAGKMVSTLAAITDEQGEWSMARIRDLGMEPRVSGGVTAANAGRAVEPLLAWHRLSGDAQALRLAEAYVGWARRTVFEEDGSIASMGRSSGHIHSVTSTLSGMAAFGAFTGDRDLLAFCDRVIENGIPSFFSSWGWGDEVTPEHPADVVLRGEINQTGDVIRTALILGAHGDPGRFDLADRYLRGMLLHTQHTEADLRRLVRDAADPADDSLRDVARRSVGGYSMQLPNDRMREGDWPIATTDITSGAVHALSECRRAQVVRDGDAYRVDLLFDYEDPQMRIRTAYPREGRVDFSARARVQIALRVPCWLDPASIRWYVDGVERDAPVADGALVLGELLRGSVGTLLFDVPVRTEEEVVDGTTYTTTWAGSQIIAIDPRGAVSPIPF